MDELIPPARPLSRRTVLGAGGAALLAAGTGVGGIALYRSRRVEVPLYSETVAFDGPGSAVLVPAGRSDDVIDGTRVLRSAREVDLLVDRERTWLAAGASWTTSGPWADLTRNALLDLRALTLPDGVPVAGWSPRWRYVWPRDASHHAAALAATGHAREALPTLLFLDRVQEPSGRFEARYLPDGSGTPDGRAPQTDGTGWALWGLERVARALPADEALETLTRLRPMIERSVAGILRLLDNPSGLPPASPDYWEVSESELTLGTVAPLAAGLSSAARSLAVLGDAAASGAADQAARRLRSAIDRHFAGYPRHLRGDDTDAAIAFLLPPYTSSSTPEVVAALELAEPRLRRPAGGLAPGQGWKQDGISWTPETALFALAMAGAGQTDSAERILTWLAGHRTAARSLPEKVLHDGSPAAVAPLGWTASLVLLAVDALRSNPARDPLPTG